MPLVGSNWRIYTVKLGYSVPPAQCLSVWNYRVTVVGQPTAQTVATNFENEIVDSLAPLVRDNVNFHTIEVVDENDVTNFGTFAINVNGTGSGIQAAPPNLCWSLRLLRSSRDMRSGWKRISGLDESYFQGFNLESTYLASLEAAVPDLIQDLNIELLQLQLVILRNRPTVSDPDIDPEDVTTWRYTDVLSAQVPDRVTTQNSRKTW